MWVQKTSWLSHSSASFFSPACVNEVDATRSSSLHGPVARPHGWIGPDASLFPPQCCYEPGALSLLVRRLRVLDIPALEALERESVERHPGHKGWLDTYRKHIERSLSEEPEGFFVAEMNNAVVGGAIARQRGAHPLTGAKHGQLLALTADRAYSRYNVAQRLLLEASLYLKSRGCKSLTVWCPVDMDPKEIDLFKNAGFSVVSWELERQL